MRLTLVAIGSRGDVAPLLALAGGLAARGAEVRVATHLGFRGEVRAAGLEAYPLPGDFRQTFASAEGRRWVAASRDPVAVGPALRELFGPGMGATLRAIDYACRDADGVLCTPLARGAGLVADARGVPSALVAVQPWILSARLAHVLAAGAEDAGSRRAAQLRLELATYWDPFREALAAIDPAYDPRRAARRSLARPAAIGVSPAVLPELDDLLPGVRLCGDWAPAEPPGWSPPSDLAEFMARPGPAPIAVGFSSHVDADPERLGAAAVAAARAEGRRTVLLTGWGGAAAPPAADVHVTDFVPHAWLYPRCAAVVHHGGAGTTAAAMRAGVPQVVTPFGQDQAFWADRVRALGVGAAAAPDGDALALRTALARASSPPAVSRAAALGGALAEEDGVDVAAEHLLGVLAAVPVGAGA